MQLQLKIFILKYYFHSDTSFKSFKHWLRNRAIADAMESDIQ